MEIAIEVNRRLITSGLPTMDEEALLYRLRKHVNHWIRDHANPILPKRSYKKKKEEDE
jgi:hypothetical protein